MTGFTARTDATAHALPKPILCDGWLADGQRFGDEVSGLAPEDVLGRWPGDLETDAVVRLAEVVGDTPTWKNCATTPPVAQRLAERVQSQPLDQEILRHLQHLQHVCYRPRLHLRVEEERVPVSRARRTPVRAVACLVSHPGDWEHRTLKDIHPSRVLARQIEDEWNLYENRVAARLVDHLLAYLAKRLEELRKIKDARDDYGDEIRDTSFRRMNRIAALWADTLESKTEEELNRTMKQLEAAQRNLQALLDAPLYQHIPRQQAVSLSLKPTNILVNDTHYRKIAALWRAWVKFGHKHQETAQQRAARRQREAAAWDRFVFHLVVRGFEALGWSATPDGEGRWRLTKRGWQAVSVWTDKMGLVYAGGTRTLCMLPLCADLTGANPDGVLRQIEALDLHREAEKEKVKTKEIKEIVVVHVDKLLHLADLDRASGWSFSERTVLFACSPWRIDSEERMSRLLHGWLCRAAIPTWPATTIIQSLPKWTGQDWLRHEGDHLVAFHAPNDVEASEARTWAHSKAKEIDAIAQRAKAAKQAFHIAPRKAVTAFQQFIDDAAKQLAGMDACPICGESGAIEARPGKQASGADATWWAVCGSCSSEWGLRPCTTCGTRYRAITPHIGLDTIVAASTTSRHEWPDKVFGRDVWAQPCASGARDQFRCSDCGTCSGGRCDRCGEGRTSRPYKNSGPPAPTPGRPPPPG